MRKLFFCGTLLLLGWMLTAGTAWAQNISRLPGSASQLYTCFRPTSSVSGPTARTTTTGYNPNGDAVTMRGELHVLLVYAGFTDDNVQGAPGYSGGDWPQDDYVRPNGQSFPANASSVSYVYNPGGPSPFSATATDPSLSNLYYQMSQFSSSPLKMYLHPFPHRINVPGNENTSAGSGFFTYTDQVIQALKTDPASATFDFSQVDRRTNHPGYQFDNSTTSPDGIVDFVVVVWRTTGTPYGLYNPVAYGGGGFANVASASGIPSANGQAYSISSPDGFTQSAGMSGIDRTIFLHEFAHCTFRCPHYLTANGVIGDHFYTGQGPGMIGGVVFSGANAWERWFNGWAELQANGDATDIQDATSLAATGGQYTLRDYLTTGDMMRIRLPNSNQYLWLENHRGRSVFDNRHTLIYDGQSTPQPLPAAPRGLIATVVDITDDRNTLLDYFTIGANGIKTLSGQGSFDYTRSATTASYNRHLWGNLLFNFTDLVPNPFGGHNQTVSFRTDTNNDGSIDWSTSIYGGNEGAIMSVRDGQFEDGLVGPNIGFANVGDKMGIGSNPAIFEHQTYDGTKLSTIQLNGLSVEITGSNRFGDLTVQVRYDDVLVDKDTRWTGDLQMVDVLVGSDADVRVSGATLTIDKSGTANRHTQTAAGDFINPTRFECPAGTTLAQDAGPLDQGSAVRVQGTNTRFLVGGTVQLGGRGNSFAVANGALLDLTNGSSYELAKGSQLVVEAGGTLVIRNGATVRGAGTITVQAGGYVCLGNGVNWQTSTAFTLSVAASATIGTSPALSPSPGASCSAVLQNFCGRLIGGNPGLRVGSRNCGTLSADARTAVPDSYTVTPNPAADQLTVSFDATQAGEVQLSVQDMQGQTRLPAQAYPVKAGPQALRLSVRELPAGVYLLVAEDEAGRHVTRLEVAR